MADSENDHDDGERTRVNWRGRVMFGSCLFVCFVCLFEGAREMF